MTRRYPLWFMPLLCVSMILAGCGGSGKKGGYYKDDGPGSDIPANIAAIPDAVPRIERHAPANLRPYVVFGKRYVPVTGDRPYRESGTASWYGRKFHGNSTANGERYDMYAMTAAHPLLPIPSYARVTRASTGRSVIVRINDRGPFHHGRVIDLSYVAAAKLGLIGPGSGQVIVEAITHQEIRNNSYARGNVSPTPTQVATAPAPITTAAPSAATVRPAPIRTQTVTVAEPISRVSVEEDVEEQADHSPVIPDALMALENTLPAQEARTTTAAGAQNLVYLQFGAFSSRTTAEALAERINSALDDSRQPAHLEHTTNNLYRVQIGPYPSRGSAVNAALRIQADTGMEPLVAAR